MSYLKELLKIRNLKLRAKKLMEELLSGYHRSRRFGSSMEFAEYRAYTQGDDVKFVDWKVFARKNKLFTRKFYEETNMKAMLILDVSGSMGFGMKMELARTIASAIAYLLHNQRDMVGLLAFSERIHYFQKPSSRKQDIERLFEVLERIEPQGRTYMESIVENFPRFLRKNSFVVIISDLETDMQSIVKIVKALESRNVETWIVHTLCKEERDIPQRGIYEFYDVETFEKVQFNSALFYKDYRKVFESWLEEARYAFNKVGARYSLIFTDEPIYKVFFT